MPTNTSDAKKTYALAQPVNLCIHIIYTKYRYNIFLVCLGRIENNTGLNIENYFHAMRFSTVK